MRRQDLEELEEYEPFLQPKEEKVLKQWNLFKNEPRKQEGGSTESSKVIDNSIQWLKIFTIVFTALIVLAMAIISKGSMLFMASQLKKNITRPYCNKHIDNREQFIVSLPDEERATWIWMLIFAYFIPEMGTFVRSVRILCFKSWDYPSEWEFFWTLFTEILPAIGSALFIFVILPELDVIKAAMLTNALCFVPGIVGFMSRDVTKFKSSIKMGLDVLAIVAQATSFVVWPLTEKKPVLYTIPVAVILISVGWWENFVSEKSPVSFISNLGKIKREFNYKTYFTYAFVAPMKCITFLLSTVVIIWIQEGNLHVMFDYFFSIFDSHDIAVKEIEPMIPVSELNYEDAIITGGKVDKFTSYWTPMSVLIINFLSTYLCYAFGKFACKIMIQTSSFAFPISLAVPVLITGLIAMCGNYMKDVCTYSDIIPPYLFFNSPPLTYLKDFISQQYPWVWLLWLFSQSWITVHIWTNNNEKLDSTEKLFLKPMYDAFFIDQSIAMNRRKLPGITRKEKEDAAEDQEEDISKPDDDKTVRIYACGTMWHETKEEMVAFLKSVLRMDEDQCAHRLVRNYLHFHKHYFYEFETHILFDDAYVRTYEEDPDPHVNTYVLDLVESVSLAASEVHATNVKIEPPVIYPTPYGGRLVWTLPGKTKMIAHLKDSAKIRKKKRWSQVMYMYYLLGFRIMDNDDIAQESIKKISENTFILALDGDIDFQPESVHLLVDYMKKNRTLGAACGRIHPIGSGAIAWYQVFEYAVGHWLQKATEHVIGCVLCSPGCFSLFRACALMDDNVMAKYTTVSEEARHYVQYDQGEDRWLCTLLLQRGYRVEYSAASDSYTHCPEGFNEFYNQRRRWMPSTTANILDLLTDYKHIVKINDNISMFYIFYQVILMIGTVIGPGTIFLMLVGAFVAAFKLDQWSSFCWNIVPILIFVIVCGLCKADTQLFFAGMISAVYGLVMMAVVIGIFMQINDDGWLAPSSIFFICMAGQFIITAILHPKEFYCLKYGVIYYVTVPSMYMLLVIYSIFNMNNVSWGTREVTVVAKKDEEEDEEKPPEAVEAPKEDKPKAYSFFGFGNPADNAGGFELSFAGLFKLMMCTYEKDSGEKEILKNIQDSLRQVENKLYQIERNQFDPQPMEPRRSTTVRIAGSRASVMRKDARRRSSAAPNPLKSLVENYDDEESLSDSLQDDSVPPNSWFYDGDLEHSEVKFLEPKERVFWEEFITEYLLPINDDANKKDKIAKDLKDLRDKMVMTFFMINALFVLVVFLLTLQKEILHVNWPIDPKKNFTYINDQNEIVLQLTYLELEPIGFVFLVFFALLIVVQFFAMMVHRFGTFCQIMVNTKLTNFFESQDINRMTPEKILRSNPIKVIKELIKLQGINDEEGENRDAPVARRNTAHFLALKKEKKQGPLIKDLDKAFAARLEKMNKEKQQDTAQGRRVTIVDAINTRRQTVLGRASQLNASTPYNREDGVAFDNAAFDDTDY